MRDEIKAKYQSKSLADAALDTKELKEKITKLEREVKDLKAEYDILRKDVLVEKMEALGAGNINLKGIGRLTIRSDAYVNTVGGKREELFEWLRSNGFEDLVTETVNASTLKAFYKEQFEKGNEVPPEDIVSFTPFDMVSITKT